VEESEKWAEKGQYQQPGMKTEKADGQSTQD
jgi:hypothetical protein